jgi:hypothetical protein
VSSEGSDALMVLIEKGSVGSGRSCGSNGSGWIDGPCVSASSVGLCSSVLGDLNGHVD